MMDLEGAGQRLSRSDVCPKDLDPAVYDAIEQSSTARSQTWS